MTFRGGASGEEAPIRIIQGSRTGLVMPDQLDVDPIHNEIFVPTRTEGAGWVYVFPRDAVGNVAPIRKLGGPGTGVSGGDAAVDPDRNLLLVTGEVNGERGILIFNRTDQGNAKPIRVISGGPKSGTMGPSGPKLIAGTNLFVGMTRRWGAPNKRDVPTSNFQSPDVAQSFVGVWSIEDTGDVEPRWTIAHDILKEVRDLAVDPKHKQLMVVDKGLNAIMVYDFPELFER
jgi:hypothetical protein